MKAEILTGDDHRTLSVTGEMTYAFNSRWIEASEELLSKAVDRYILDLRGLTQIDSAGLGMMLSLKQRGEEFGIRLRLVFEEDTIVGQMIRLGKFHELFEREA